MKTIALRRGRAIVPMLLLLGACQEILRPEEVMDRIERSVTLPDGAAPLSAYDRSYAFSGPGRIKAIFVRAADRSAAGKRSWLADPAKLPLGFESGCRQVTVLYDVTVDRFLYVACTGLA